MREVEPSRWPAIGAIKIIEGGKEGKEGKEGAVPYSDLAMAEEVGAVEAVDRIAKHHGAVVDTMRRMYVNMNYMNCVWSYGCRFLCSVAVMFHYYWCIRKPWSSFTMQYNKNNNILAHNHHTNYTPQIFLSLYIYKHL